jgi:hypothetical protein
MKNLFGLVNGVVALSIALLAGCAVDAGPTVGDENGDGKGDKGTTRDPGDAPSTKRVFVTSDPNGWNGNLMAAGGGTDGLDGADRLCQKAASAASLDGTWAAWLSSGSVNAIDRIPDGPRVLVDGTAVTSGWVRTASGTDHSFSLALAHPIDLDAAGQRVVTTVWSGTVEGGSRAESAPCGDWSSSSSSDFGTFGFSDQTGSQWTNLYSMKCLNSANLYCFEL